MRWNVRQLLWARAVWGQVSGIPADSLLALPIHTTRALFDLGTFVAVCALTFGVFLHSTGPLYQDSRRHAGRQATYFLPGVLRTGHLRAWGREGRERERKKMDCSSDITGIFIKFCLGERRFTELEMKGKSAWGPRKVMISHARFSSHTACGWEIRTLWLDTFINSALSPTLVPG